MTNANQFKMPLLMPATQAAHIIQKGLMKNRARIALPVPDVRHGPADGRIAARFAGMDGE